MHKGLDYVISRGVQAIEADAKAHIETLIRVINAMGAVAEGPDDDYGCRAKILRIWDEYKGED